MTNSMKQTVIKNPTWWRRRTVMERGLTLVATVAFLLAVALAVALGVFMIRNQKEDDLPSMPAALQNDKRGVKVIQRSDAETSVCLTKECIHTASTVLKSMDLDVDPCDDFYNYACGSYIRNSHIPDEKSGINAFSAISDQLQQKLRVAFDEEDTESSPRAFKIAKQLYGACMNKTLIEKRGLQPLKDILKELGGWPVLDGDSWNADNFNWRTSVYQFRKSGYSVDYFMDFSVSTDAKNSTVRTINIDQASLGLSREFMVKGLEDKLVHAYYQYMVDVAVIMGADRERATKELRESLEFEIGLANISWPSEKRRNGTLLYNAMTVSEMQTKFPSIPWLEYISNLMGESAKITNNEVVIVSVPSFLSELEKLLSHTPKKVMANYVMWRATSASVSYMNEELRSRQLKYLTSLTGKTEREARWKECVDVVTSGLSLSVGSIYVRKYFNEDAKRSALEMVEDIRKEFKQILREVDWMDDNTRTRALDKAQTMSVHIAYPDELLDDAKLDAFYANLNIDPQLYIESVLNLTKFGTGYSFSRLRQRVNKTEWISHGRPAVVNAYYNSIENSIQFPAGILQGTFFGNERPKYMNYGAIGFVIGHEITHGFDDQGRQFDKDGNLVDWWEADTKEQYLKKASCIIEQYGNYTEEMTGLNLNGINTQGENIADNGGIKEAYRAYLSWEKRQTHPEPVLPGFPQKMGPRQFFWISAAQSWCSRYRPEAMKQRITTGVHSPGQFRVLGPLSNRPEFAQDFNCPLGTKMNPVNKCHVW